MASHYDADDYALLQETSAGPRLRLLQVPPALALGLYEHLTDTELQEHAADINAEITRRYELQLQEATHEHDYQDDVR